VTSRESFEHFCELAATYSVVPVTEELIADTVTPVGACEALLGDGPGFLLESVEHGERYARWSFLGRHPVATVVIRGAQVSVVSGELPPSVPRDRGALAVIEEILQLYRAPREAELPPLSSGIVGYLGYDIVREIERLGPPPADDRGYPDAVVSIIGELVAFDHFSQRVVLIANVIVPPEIRAEGGGLPDPSWLAPAYAEARQVLGRLRADLERPSRHRLVPIEELSGRVRGESVVASMTSAQYCAAVERAKAEIRAGEIFQVVLSKRFDLEISSTPLEIYRVLRQMNPSPYMFLLCQGGVSVVGASPEALVRVESGRIVSRPIAGTRRRGESEDEDRLLSEELRADPKEVAEHVMLVDLARNDVGRVARFGTVVVEELMGIERYSHVMHLTSEVSGELRPGLSSLDVLRATLPAGTVSGAPKVRAMQLIDELEITKRGPYAGVVGYLDFSGNLDTAIAIRTLVIGADGKGSVQAGAGIVADSVARSEDEECWNKAAAMLASVASAARLASPEGP
jgi:anthranilate synthase component 1